ncbi:CpaF family protein [Tersicoccus phoenicis]|uniref:CpaF family protein n=1 Tax=Tersicoccus phoenicis TaxID=554083 RepID=UPI0009FE9E9B|nr:ATPase, T2SS/T4P/T4SS family [Tersicoccus phoenicis]
MTDAVQIVEGEVRELIRLRGLDPARQGPEVRLLVDAAVNDYSERALVTSLPPLGALSAAQRQVFDAVAGFGPLQPLLDDPGIEEIWINSPREVYVARGGESELTSLSLTDQQVRDLVERMLASSGRRLDLSSPFVDAALPDGSRLHVVIPDVTRRHWSVNIRKFVVRARRLEHLVELGSLSPSAARFLATAVGAGLNILVSGATQAGKTTLLNCLGAAIGPRERVITVEEVFELHLPLRDVVGMQCRQENLEGTGEIPLRRLVKEALRMRPDRLIVGEVREAEALDMLIALNAGLPGFAGLRSGALNASEGLESVRLGGLTVEHVEDCSLTPALGCYAVVEPAGVVRSVTVCERSWLHGFAPVAEWVAALADMADDVPVQVFAEVGVLGDLEQLELREPLTVGDLRWQFARAEDGGVLVDVRSLLVDMECLGVAA